MSKDPLGRAATPEEIEIVKRLLKRTGAKAGRKVTAWLSLGDRPR